MKLNPTFGTFLLPALVVLLATSCKKEISNGTEEASASVQTAKQMNAGNAAEKKLETALLKSVRQATSRFNSTTQAIKAGYVPSDHCVSAPGLGGMGYHWVNPTLVDPVFDPLKPEALLYARGPGGNLRLVAVEYIVINVGQPRPMFGDQPFDIGGAPIPASHWTLHVWLHEHNPAGMFAPFNPNISCP